MICNIGPWIPHHVSGALCVLRSLRVGKVMLQKYLGKIRGMQRTEYGRLRLEKMSVVERVLVIFRL